MPLEMRNYLGRVILKGQNFDWKIKVQMIDRPTAKKSVTYTKLIKHVGQATSRISTDLSDIVVTLFHAQTGKSKGRLTTTACT